MRVVHLLSCGGTIEKIYLEHSGAVANIDAKIERYLQRLRLPDTEVTSERLMNKDSLEMGDEDRRIVLEAVQRKLRESPAPIIITHGTDTLVETGMFLERNLSDLTEPIIFTGAMTPLGFEGTDALQNLTESLLASQLLKPGIYLVMHNQVFPIHAVRKDRNLARFVPI